MKSSAALYIALMLCAALSSCGTRDDTGTGGKTVLELDSGWRFREAGGEGWMPATVPGCVHTDLLAAGRIPDPFFGDNEKDLQWIEEREWIYSCSFTAGDSLLGHENISIEFTGLDTYASVALNDSFLLEADNMFRPWKTDIGKYIKRGENILEVQFLPPGPAEAGKRDSLGYALPGGDRVFTRKAAYHYGWDWGPRFVTCGIWRPVRITGRSGAMIADIRTGVPEISPERASVEIEVNLLIDSGGEIELVLAGESGDSLLSKRIERPGAGPFEQVSFEIDIEEPVFWWPAGLGGQHLYGYSAELRIDGNKVDSSDFTVGIRTMELVMEEDDAGESFYFRVNGVPVFMKGANWVPMDSFLPRSSPAGYRRLLTAAKDANMNMLRVWGGGIYENDIFYDLCDSLGIVVWQDFMFACAMYPGDQGFFENAGNEAAHNIIRLGGHPCIALWCGNNENDEGWRNWGWQDGHSRAQKEMIVNAYANIFTNMLPAVVEMYGPGYAGRTPPYHPSSPRHGRADPRSLIEGDAHYWGVWHDAEPFEVLGEKIPRFMSEFGFQSLPSMGTIEMFAGPEGLRLDSDAMLSHQKHPRGYRLIRQYMERWYRVPERFEDYVYVSQLLQAGGIRLGIEAQRRAMPYCMGSLYWQLGDCWPAVSWSSIDYRGEWKALHYAARDAFAPLLVSTVVDEGSLRVYLVSDRLEEKGGWLAMKVVRFDGPVLWENTVNARAPANGSLEVFAIPLDELLAGADRSSVVFSAEFECPGEEASRALQYFAPPKELKLPDPGLEYGVKDGDPGVIISMRTRALAKDVFLQFDGSGPASGSVHFRENFFDMLPGEIVTFRIDTDIPWKDLRRRIRIRTLRDTY